MKFMKKLTLFLIVIIFISCSSDDENTPENISNTANYKIEYISQLSDADFNLDVTFMWTDANGQVQSETTNIIDPQAYSILSDEKNVEIINMIGVKFKVNSGSNFLSDTFVKVTNLDTNSNSEVTNAESISASGSANDRNTLTVIYNAETDTFQSDYSTTN